MTAAQKWEWLWTTGWTSARNANTKPGCRDDDHLGNISNSFFSFFCQYQSPGTIWFTSVDIIPQGREGKKKKALHTSTPEDRLRAILSVNKTGYCPLKWLLSIEKLEQRRNGKVRRKWKITLSSVFLVNSDWGLKKKPKPKQQTGKKNPQKAPTQQICSTTTIHQFPWCSQSTDTELYPTSTSALKWAPCRILL